MRPEPNRFDVTQVLPVRGPARRPRVWSVRFDLAALRPPDPLPPGRAQALQQHPAWPALVRWCLQGCGPGHRPWWQPGALPAVDARFTVACLLGADAADRNALATALGLERDGSLQLQARATALGRLLLRLQTKWQDLQWWRMRQPTDAWDCGWLRDTPEGLQALASFQPRRATLVVAEGLVATVLQVVLEDLCARQAGFAHPVRLLVLGASAPAPAWAAVDVQTLVLTAVRNSSARGA